MRSTLPGNVERAVIEYPPWHTAMLVLVGAMFLPYPSFPGHEGMIPCGGWQGFCVTAALIRFKNYRWSDRPGFASAIIAGNREQHMDRYCYRSGDCLRVGFGVSQS